MITKQLEADILRYHHVEQWGVHTIARQLHIHHDTVNRVLAQAGMPRIQRATRSSIIEPYLPFITETLDKHPTLTAARLFHMATARGYPGGQTLLRAWVAELRPRAAPEAYLRLRTLPGEQGQVDWGAFGYLTIGKAKRPLVGFVMVLSWSRAIFLRFYLNQRMESFLHGHVSAFAAWGGLPRTLLYDNLKSAVLERQGDAIRFHPTLLELSAHYHFEPRPVAVARGNEKGRVERAIRYIRDSFFAGRQWTDLDDLNAQAAQWCAEQAMRRPCPEDKGMSVKQAFAQEQPQLMKLPENPFPAEDIVAVNVPKTPYVRYDLNDYSVPHALVRKTVSVHASQSQVRIMDRNAVIAVHARSYGKGEQIENPDHVAELVAHKRQARHHRGQDRLAHAVPLSSTFLEAAVQRHYSLSVIVRDLLSLLGDYGASELAQAMQNALERDVPHPNAVRQMLEQRRELRQQPPPVAIPLSNPKAQIVVRPANLSDYDQLSNVSHDSSGHEVSSSALEVQHDAR